jgi:hypothetical protein
MLKTIFAVMISTQINAGIIKASEEPELDNWMKRKNRHKIDANTNK